MTSYAELEKGMLSYRDLITVPVRENREPLVSLRGSGVAWSYREPFLDMKDALKGDLRVRSTVRVLLIKAQRLLTRERPGCFLSVCYGYRDPAIQRNRFLAVLKRYTDRFYENPADLYEEVHRRVAVPTVAGHPTGAAVDITLYGQTELDFGAPMYDYSTKRCYVFSPEVSPEQKENRNILRTVMMKAGFAPFDGEWWHFSYGDREWARYYGMSAAIYDQIKFT